MNYPDGDPVEWEVGERQIFLAINAFGWTDEQLHNIEYSSVPNAEDNAKDCQALRRHLVAIGYVINMHQKRLEFNIIISRFLHDVVPARGEMFEGIHPSENRATVIAACRALLKQEKDNTP